MILKNLNLPENQLSRYQTGARITFIDGILVLLSGVTSIGTIPLLLILIVLLLAPVFFGILV